MQTNDLAYTQRRTAGDQHMFDQLYHNVNSDPGRMPWLLPDRMAYDMGSHLSPNIPVDYNQLPLYPQVTQHHANRFTTSGQAHVSTSFMPVDYSNQPLNTTRDLPTMHQDLTTYDWEEELKTISNMPTPSLSTLPDYFTPWPTPEPERGTLEDIDVWLAVNDPQHLDGLTPSPSAVSTPSYHGRASSMESIPQSAPTKEKPQCWEHGCNGRTFSTIGNLVRHRREKSDQRPQRACPRCGALFSRTTARNQHLAKDACNRIRRYSNGRQRPDWMTRVASTDDE